MLRIDPDRPIIRWAWTRHGAYRQCYATLSADPAYAQLTVVGIASRQDLRRLLAAAAGPAATGDGRHAG